MKYRLVYRLGVNTYYLVPNDRWHTYLSSKWSGTQLKEKATLMTKEEIEEFVRSNPSHLVTKITFEEVKDVLYDD